VLASFPSQSGDGVYRDCFGATLRYALCESDDRDGNDHHHKRHDRRAG